MPVDDQPRSTGSACGSSCPTRSDAASISSMVAGPVATSAGSAAVARLRSSKTSSPVTACGSSGTVRNTTDGDERQRALAADDQVAQDVDRPVVVEEAR